MIRYLGPGHTEDNLVVALPKLGVLFGGCLIRPPGATTLGNNADANLGTWADTVLRVANAFPDVSVVVPSHGPPAGPELLRRTVDLARAVASKQR